LLKIWKIESKHLYFGHQRELAASIGRKHEHGGPSCPPLRTLQALGSETTAAGSPVPCSPAVLHAAPCRPVPSRLGLYTARRPWQERTAAPWSLSIAPGTAGRQWRSASAAGQNMLVPEPEPVPAPPCLRPGRPVTWRRTRVAFSFYVRFFF